MTPDIALVRDILHVTRVPVRIMIRETEAGYEAAEQDLQKMKAAILRLKTLPVEGFVLGLLKGNVLDREGMQLLIDSASPLKITVHKALDQSAAIEADIAWLNTFPNIDTILSSGGAARAADGMQMLLKMKSWFRGEVMAAGKITPDVLPALHAGLNLNWYHGRAIVAVSPEA